MLRRELSIFLIVGTLTVLVDFFTYRSSMWIGLIEVHMAKATGFVMGTVFAYFANRFWTFSRKLHAPGSLWRFVILYASTLAANVSINAVGISLLGDYAFSIQAAFLLATLVSATLNFLGMKFFVFKTGSASEVL